MSKVKSAEERFGIDPDEKILANPFTDRFLDEEVAFYGLPGPYSANGIEVQMIKPRGRLDDYLNKNFRISGGEVPVLAVDGNLWMSLTYMEIQSMYVPISLCRGVVGTAGLGLGYFALRAASLERVERVDVFEVEPRVADFFVASFGNRPEMEKIKIVVGDARKEMLWKPHRRSFDLIFMDVYPTLLGDEVVEDARLFRKNGSFEEYRFWGQERVILDAIVEDREREEERGLDKGEPGEDLEMVRAIYREDNPHPDPQPVENAYFRAWQTTKIILADRRQVSIAELYEQVTDQEFRDAVFGAIG